MKPRLILCVGNRFHPGDWFGPRVFDHLTRLALPAGIEAIDGGLAGLDLAIHFEGAERVVLVDTLVGARDDSHGRGFTTHDLLASLLPASVPEASDHPLLRGDHSGGLAYLLRTLPHTCPPPLPEILLLGIDPSADDESICAAARHARVLAEHGLPVPSVFGK